MAHAILDILNSNPTLRDLPLAPPGLASQIRHLISASRHPSASSHPTTTLELNAAFLDLVSQQSAPDIKSLLIQWGTSFACTQWGAVLDVADVEKVLDGLVDYVQGGVRALLRLQEQGGTSIEQRFSFCERVEMVGLVVEGLRERTRWVLARGGVTDEEELAWMMENGVNII